VRPILTSILAVFALGAVACSGSGDDEAVGESNGAFAENAPVACTKAPCAERPIIWVHGHAGNPHDADAILSALTAPGERFDSTRYVGTSDHQDWAARSIPRREWLFSFDYYVKKGSDAPHSYTAGAGRVGSFGKLCPDHDGYDQGFDHEFSADLAALIDDVLRATGASQVDVFAHSMGGLITRSVITFGGGRETIANAFFIATPHKGVPAASLETIVSDEPDWMAQHELTELDRFKLTSKSDFRACGAGGSSHTFPDALMDAELATPKGPVIHCMKGSEDRFIYDDSAKYDRCVDYAVIPNVDHAGVLKTKEAAAKAREVLGGTMR
jgi:hypothetical protein